jgi:radical SAM protein with 4Fe4S-binding SPASM domain
MYSRVYVEVTNICNMHCSFCHGHHRVFRQMTREEFARILEQLTGKTQYIYYHLMGEPLTHPQLPDFLKMAAEKGFRSVITTNGTLLHKRGAELLQAGVHKFNISLHSFEENDDAGQREYLRRVAEFSDTAAKAGTLVSLRLWNKGHDNGRNETTEEVFRRLLPGEWQENSRGYRIREKLYLEYGDRFAWPDKAAPDGGDRVFCYGLRDQFGILCDGTVVPCCLDSEGVINLGNIHEGDIADILNSPRAKAMVKGFGDRKATEDLCRRCGYARRFG